MSNFKVTYLNLVDSYSTFFVTTHEHTHTHVRTRPRKVTYSFKQVGHSRQSILGGVVPVVDVREGAKRPWMRIIPDSPDNTPHQSKPLPHSAVYTSQPRRRLRGRRPRATRTPSRVQTPHAHVACCTLHRMRVAGILWESLVVGRVVASARSTDAGGRSLSPTRRHQTEAGQ